MSDTKNQPGIEIQDRLNFKPLTKEIWPHFEDLFGPRGACGNCWCMYPRLSKKDFNEGKKEKKNKLALKKLVWEDQPTGILAFDGDNAVAWCAFAPREVMIRIENSRIHKRIDDQPVWSIPCLFIHKNYRRKGMTVALLNAVISYAKHDDIRIIEAYPAIDVKEGLPDSFIWFGKYRSFEKVGFEIVSRRSENRPMVRYYIAEKNKTVR